MSNLLLLRYGDATGRTKRKFCEMAIAHDCAAHIFRQSDPRPCLRCLRIPGDTLVERGVSSRGVAEVRLRCLDAYAALVGRSRHLVRHQPTARLSRNYKGCST